MLDDEQKLHKIQDIGDGKALQIYTKDLSHHDLEDKIAIVDSKPWTSIAVCDRVITFESSNYSLYGKFKFESKKQCIIMIDDIDDEDILIDERNLPGTLFSM